MKPLSGRQFCRLRERNGWSLLRIGGLRGLGVVPGKAAADQARGLSIRSRRASGSLATEHLTLRSR